MRQGLVILLQFTAFNIESSQNGCGFDHLTITDGDGTTLMQKSCGIPPTIVIGGLLVEGLPADITSRTNFVKLDFKTDDSVEKSGWSVSWTALTPG